MPDVTGATKREQALASLQRTPQPTRAAVARQLGVAASTVSNWARQAGLPPGAKGRPRKHASGIATPRSYSLADAEYDRAMVVLSGVGVKDVADLLGQVADGEVTIVVS